MLNINPEDILFTSLQFHCTDVDRNYDIGVLNTVHSGNCTYICYKVMLDEEYDATVVLKHSLNLARKGRNYQVE